MGLEQCSWYELIAIAWFGCGCWIAFNWRYEFTLIRALICSLFIILGTFRASAVISPQVSEPLHFEIGNQKLPDDKKCTNFKSNNENFKKVKEVKIKEFILKKFQNNNF